MFYLHSFLHFKKKFIPSYSHSFKLWPLKSNYQANVFFKVIQHGYEIFQTVLSLNCKIIWLITFNLVTNLLLITNKSLNLDSVIYAEMNTVSITNIILLQNERGSYKFRLYLKLLPLTVERFCNLSYKPIYGILWLSSYWLMRID